MLSSAASIRLVRKLDATNPQHKQLLDRLSATRYVEADDASYDKLREAARQAGLLGYPADCPRAVRDK